MGKPGKWWRIKWAAKLDSAGKPIAGCFLSECGYTAASTGGDAPRFTLTRPGESVPFAYTDRKGDLSRLVRADIQASKLAGGN